MNSIQRHLGWAAVALLGAGATAIVALNRGETINAGWLLFAAIASYAIAYRFYARFIQRKVLETDDSRATPAERGPGPEAGTGAVDGSAVTAASLRGRR